MGYRSDVSIIIYGTDRDITAFKAGERVKGYPKGMTHHPLDEPVENKAYHERLVYHTDDGETMLEFNWFNIKWYETYPHIAYWEQLMSLFDQAFPSLCMEFVRLGESTDDIVVTYYGSDCQYYLNVERTIYKTMGIKKEVEDEYRQQYDN
jgi:hypothetical protein